MKIVDLNSLSDLPVSHNPLVRKRVLFAKGDLPPFTQISRSVFPPGEVCAAHRHADMRELFWVESGEGLMLVGPQEITLSPGICVVVEPGEDHEVRNTSGKEALVLTQLGWE